MHIISDFGSWMDVQNSHLRDLPSRLSSRCGIDDGAKEGRYNQVAAFFGKHL
jgi:hypothetical protein